MILGNTIRIQAATSKSVAAVTSPSIYWGALVNAAPSNANMQPGGPIDTFESHSGKKISIGPPDGGAKKAAWITDALTTQIPTNLPKIKAVVWFYWNMSNCQTCVLESSQAATDAWAAGIGSAVYATNQYANLNTSPIPPLAAPVIAPTVTPVAATATPATSVNSTTLLVIADSYINSAKLSSTAGGTSTTLRVDGSPVQTTFLKFDLTPLAGKTISTVRLKFKTTSNTVAGSVNSPNIKLVDDMQWKERYLSYSNPVAISATVLGTVPANSVPNTWYVVTLTPAPIQPNVGGLLSVAMEATGSDELILYSREATDKPQFIITYN